MATIADNLQAVRARLGRAHGVTLLAVSKGHGVDRIRQAVAAGQKAFGENYVQEAVQKMDALPGLEWHLIGPLQSNKTRLAAQRFAWIHTLDREKIAKRLSEQRPAAAAPLNVLIQVNVSREASKSGVSFDEIPPLAGIIAALPRLRLRGLMAIPEPGAGVALQFRAVHECYENLKSKFGFDTLSMGMSDDMEAAIAEGATLVRIGSAIFGQRPEVRDAA